MNLRRLTQGALPFVIIGLIARITYWLHVSDEAWFLAPGMDPLFYTEWADSIRSGHGADYIPFPRAPLYPYILAFIRSVFGENWIFPRLANLLCDSVTVIAIFSLARRIGSLTAGRIAALVFALSGAAIYFSGELLMTSIATMLLTLVIYWLSDSTGNASNTSAILCGIALGLLVLLRPNALLLLPITILLFSLSSRKLSTHFLRSTLPHILAFLPFLLTVVVVNYSDSGSFVPVSTQGGVNFYIGNARGADGWTSDLPGVGANWLDEDAKFIAERSAGEALNSGAVSKQFWRLGLEEIASDPGGWMALMGRKLLLLINIREMGNNRPLLLPKLTAPYMKALLLVSLGLIFPLSVVGVIRLWNQRKVRIITAILTVYGVSLLIFFVNSRYRMPLLPLAAVLAGCGAVNLIQAFKKRTKTASLIAILAVGVIAAWPPWVNESTEHTVQAYFVAGNALLRMGEAERALKQYETANQVQPGYPELQLNRGVALLQLGDTTGADRAFNLELQYNRSNARATNNLGVIRESIGDLQTAAAYYRQAYQWRPNYEDARLNLGEILLKMGDAAFQSDMMREAGEHYAESAELLPDDPRPLYRQALAAMVEGDQDFAGKLVDSTLALDPAYRPALQWLDINRFRE